MVDVAAVALVDGTTMEVERVGVNDVRLRADESTMGRKVDDPDVEAQVADEVGEIGDVTTT